MLRISASTSFFIVQVAATPLVAEPESVVRELDKAYGDRPWQMLDVYRPASMTSDTPALVFFFGGGWKSGDKSDLKGIGESFASEGIIFVAPNYRLGSQAVFPGFIRDAAKALAYVHSDLATESVADRPVYVGGWSAGAYNAAMVALNQTYLSDEGMSSDLLGGVIGLAGPYAGGLCSGVRCPDVFPDNQKETWRAADYVDETDPPLLLIAGEIDRFVEPYHHKQLAAAASMVGVDASVVEIPERGHSALLYLLATDGSEVRDAILSFISTNRQQ